MDQDEEMVNLEPSIKKQEAKHDVFEEDKKGKNL